MVSATPVPMGEAWVVSRVAALTQIPTPARRLGAKAVVSKAVRASKAITAAASWTAKRHRTKRRSQSIRVAGPAAKVRRIEVNLCLL
jgi:hypothetical protein